MGFYCKLVSVQYRKHEYGLFTRWFFLLVLQKLVKLSRPFEGSQPTSSLFDSVNCDNKLLCFNLFLGEFLNIPENIANREIFF